MLRIFVRKYFIVFFQMVAQGKEPPTYLPEPKVKKKQIKIKKDVQKAKSMLPSTNETTTARVTISEMQDEPKGSNKHNKYPSPNKIKRTFTNVTTKKYLKPNISKKMSSKDSEVASQKIGKKKEYKKGEFKPIRQGKKDDIVY